MDYESEDMDVQERLKRSSINRCLCVCVKFGLVEGEIHFVILNYHRKDFNCKYLLIVNCEFFLRSQLTIIQCGVNVRAYWIRNLA